ncbi:hypothetical protein [Candidatus Nitrosocosmicus hydrocola]|uniref:hypothetical protein n=1 Tax=Candidatus Nitrosocosmicus hydrocola TaxID=1826872 RepID=UPI0011E5A33B|nr:hypothetical protein [Candidatus Nitrosocosmicus hydrocola]
MFFVSILFITTFLLLLVFFQGYSTYGIPVNQELHIYQSWCVMKGSPLANELSTDEKLLSIQDSVNDNIYTDQAGIVFESAINHPITDRITSPKLDDTIMRPIGIEQEGDIYRDDPSTEFIALKNKCKTDWSVDSDGKLIPINGILSINLNRYLNDSGHILKEGDSQIIGESLCKRVGSNPNCKIPFDGWVSVIDNYYTSNGMGDLYQDVLNQNPGHEAGHALGFKGHSPDSKNLMYVQQVANSSGMVNNTEITVEQKEKFWFEGKQIPGSYLISTIPVSKIMYVSPWLTFALMDYFNEDIPDPRSDLSSIDLFINVNTSSITLDITFDSVLTSGATENMNYDYWILTDRGNNLFTKNFTNLINSTFGTNNLTTLLNAENQKILNIHSSIDPNNNQSKFNGTLWAAMVNGSSINPVPINISNITLSQMYNLHSNISNSSLTSGLDDPIFSSVTININNSSQFNPLVPFTIQALSTHEGKIIDVINPRFINTTEYLPSNLLENTNQRSETQ